jgi:DNA-directed RNA polymerase subunit RPC12/RpoP
MIEGYKCSFCGKFDKYKAIMIDHESKCPNNPATKSCSTCGDKIMGEYEDWLSIVGCKKILLIGTTTGI